MRSEIKYLGTGLLIGMIAASLLLGGIFFTTTLAAPAPTAAPRSLLLTATSQPQFIEPTSTPLLLDPTFTFTPTFFVPASSTAVTPFYTSTVTPADPLAALINSGTLFITGSLSQLQQEQLYAASLKYTRGTTAESKRVGETINGRGYGAPSDICGPLSIAILQDAGLVNKSIDPHDFWLLNPDDSANRLLLKKAFPPNQYEDQRIKLRLNRFNWRESPLQPGDFIYIYAGTGGNFEHMLVVNRVDSQMRAYSVTNYNTPNGFVIGEVLLYDPADPTQGIFRQWTAEQYAELGSTGFAGIELWRMRTP